MKDKKITILKYETPRVRLFRKFWNLLIPEYCNKCRKQFVRKAGWRFLPPFSPVKGSDVNRICVCIDCVGGESGAIKYAERVYYETLDLINRHLGRF